MKKLTFITGNPAKAGQLAKYLGVPVLHHKLDLTEIQSLDLTTVSTHKVKEAYSLLKVPVIIDDVSLSFNAWGKLPGPFIRYFLDEIGNEKLCTMLRGAIDRSARATVAIGYSDGRTTKIFLGEVSGRIAGNPKGDRGFGWDRIFIPEGFNKTRGEMDERDYDATSPRKMALEKFEHFLTSGSKIRNTAKG